MSPAREVTRYANEEVSAATGATSAPGRKMHFSASLDSVCLSLCPLYLSLCLGSVRVSVRLSVCLYPFTGYALIASPSLSFSFFPFSF